jgi:hypothetical protein
MMPTQSPPVSIWAGLVSVWALFRTHMDIELFTEDAKSPEPKFGAWCHSTRLKAIGAAVMILPVVSDRPLGGDA